jgi:hypothetical protein
MDLDVPEEPVELLKEFEDKVNVLLNAATEDLAKELELAETELRYGIFT